MHPPNRWRNRMFRPRALRLASRNDDVPFDFLDDHWTEGDDVPVLAIFAIDNAILLRQSHVVVPGTERNDNNKMP